jgi:hypothetical protein
VGDDPGRLESVWEDGIGRRDEDARVLWQDETAHAPDPQSVRYGEGRCRVVVQASIGGPVYRGRPYVDVYWHEGLRPSYLRLTPAEARRVADLFARAAERAETAAGGERSA